MCMCVCSCVRACVCVHACMRVCVCVKKRECQRKKVNARESVCVCLGESERFNGVSESELVGKGLCCDKG